MDDVAESGGVAVVEGGQEGWYDGMGAARWGGRIRLSGSSLSAKS